MLAFGVPSSSFNTIMPATAVYLISCPPIFTECFVCTILSSGGFFSSFAFSADLSPALSAGFSPAGCCEIAITPLKQSKNAAIRNRNRLFIDGKPHTNLRGIHAREIVCDPVHRVNRAVLYQNRSEGASRARSVPEARHKLAPPVRAGTYAS